MVPLYRQKLGNLDQLTQLTMGEISPFRLSMKDALIPYQCLRMVVVKAKPKFRDFVERDKYRFG